MSDTLSELLQDQNPEHWGEKCEFTPFLLNKVHGDGQQLLLLFPINERPRYWVVRVDSSCTRDDEVHEILDDIYDEIDDQFGQPPEGDRGIGDERPYFPSYDGDGTSWHFVRKTNPSD